MPAQSSIRLAEWGDMEAITEVYNEAILTTTAPFDTEPKRISARREWFQSYGERHPVLVAEVEGKEGGWTSLSTWSDRRAYEERAETSFYVKSEYRGQGIGRRLKGAIIDEARRLGFHPLIVRVAEGSKERIHLKERFGFLHVGTLKEVGAEVWPAAGGPP